MRVLLTGGAGYIGSVTTASLLDRGHDVLIVDDLRNGHRDLVPAGARLLVGDVADPDVYAQALGDIDACLHFAASTEAGASMQDPQRFFANNTAGTLRLLEALIDAGVRRFVLSSTAAVYGIPRRLPIREEDPTEPTNAYGVSKLLIEQALSWLADLRGLRYAALRYFNAAGATPERGESHDPETHLIPLVLEVAASRRDRIAIYGTDYPTPDGTCVRDYIHVADLAQAHVRALEALDVQERIVCNLGNGTGFSVRQVIDTARAVTGRPIPAREEARRPGDPPQLVASSGRAGDLLGWQARQDLEAIIRSAWEWHHRRWTA